MSIWLGSKAADFYEQMYLLAIVIHYGIILILSLMDKEYLQ